MLVRAVAAAREAPRLRGRARVCAAHAGALARLRGGGWGVGCVPVRSSPSRLSLLLPGAGARRLRRCAARRPGGRAARRGDGAQGAAGLASRASETRERSLATPRPPPKAAGNAALTSSCDTDGALLHYTRAMALLRWFGASPVAGRPRLGVARPRVPSHPPPLLSPPPPRRDPRRRPGPRHVRARPRPAATRARVSRRAAPPPPCFRPPRLAALLTPCRGCPPPARCPCSAPCC